jgi:nucleotide-binding universal stress UspA family protein
MERFVRRADRPCLVTPAAFQPVSKILVGVDGSACAARALREAIGLANALQIPLILLTVAETESDAEAARRISLDAHSIARAHNCAAAALLATGAPATRLLEQAADTGCDLAVIGSHGHGMIYDRLIGGAASHVVARAQIPVMLVR